MHNITLSDVISRKLRCIWSQSAQSHHRLYTGSNRIKMCDLPPLPLYAFGTRHLGMGQFYLFYCQICVQQYNKFTRYYVITYLNKEQNRMNNNLRWKCNLKCSFGPFMVVISKQNFSRTQQESYNIIYPALCATDILFYFYEWGKRVFLF